VRHIGIFGGSFNPIHLGHLLAAQSVAESFELDLVLFLPCNVSPFKCGARDLADGPERLEMVQLSVAGYPLFEPCASDLERGGVSYARDTVVALKQRYPQDRLSFIVGMDALRELSHWHKVDEMLTLCEVISIERPGVDLPLTAAELAFPEDVSRRLLAHVVRGRHCEISASDIRRRIAQGRSIRYLVCPAVETYIRSRGLYTEKKEA
jgi:nicotinate-nucleotide adenylyltransferase